MRLRVAHRVPRTTVEGPGVRFALWVQGCTLRCPGCCNPEMFAPDGGGDVSVDALADEVLASGAEGLSLLGGEPFEQAGPCGALATRVRAAGLSVMVFTGYRLEQLRDRGDAHELLGATDVLVDGPFVRAEAERSRRWVGSKNQRVWFLTGRYGADDPRFAAGNELVIELRRGELSVHGFPHAPLLGGKLPSR